MAENCNKPFLQVISNPNQIRKHPLNNSKNK